MAWEVAGDFSQALLGDFNKAKCYSSCYLSVLALKKRKRNNNPGREKKKKKRKRNRSPTLPPRQEGPRVRGPLTHRKLLVRLIRIFSEKLDKFNKTVG